MDKKCKTGQLLKAAVQKEVAKLAWQGFSGGVMERGKLLCNSTFWKNLIERNGKIESSLFGECAAAVFKHSPLSETCSPARYAPGFSPTWKHFSECAPPQQISWAGPINIPIRGQQFLSNIYWPHHRPVSVFKLPIHKVVALDARERSSKVEIIGLKQK